MCIVRVDAIEPLVIEENDITTTDFKDNLIATKDLHPKPKIICAHSLKLLTPLQCVKVCTQEVCAAKFETSKKRSFSQQTRFQHKFYCPKRNLDFD